MQPADGNKRRVDSVPSGAITADLMIAAAIGFVTFLLLTAGFSALSSPGSTGRAVAQPVEFNHRLHVEDLGLDCAECHEFVETEAFSGLPSADTCSLCHEEAQGESPEEAKLVALLGEGQPLEWGRLFRQPAHVYYSHSRHVAVAELECEQCHAGIAASERPPRRARRLSMDGCIECHDSSGVEAGCTSCHR